MNEDVESYIGTSKTFTFITSLKINEIALQYIINKYERYLDNTTGLNANDGRFEGFKSSGKIGHIENVQLQNDILDLYEEDIPHFIGNTNANTKNQLEFASFIKDNVIWVTNSTANFKQIISTNKSFAHARVLASKEEIVGLYDVVIAKNKKIAAINKEKYLKQLPYS